MNEFDIIKNYFATQTEHRKDVMLGIGDDAAIVRIPKAHELVLTTDTLVSGIHFFESALPFDVGYKSLAVNLSDLAAMGATPAWVTLAITLPNDNEEWINGFCAGFFTLANRYQTELIGGDLTHGPLSITVQAMGFVPEKKALLRKNAKANDLIYVSGTLGDANLALQFLQKKIDIPAGFQRSLLSRLHRPEPRIATGEILQMHAHAAIDISDGFAADLSHILDASQVGAIVYVDRLPLSDEMKHTVAPEKAIELALAGGDDYELCFTIPAEKRAEIEQKLATIPCRFTCVGKITETKGLDLRYEDGKKYHGPMAGYQHF